MAQILKNKHLEIHVDLPLKNYSLSRFDWTGKIVLVKFQDICFSGIERTDIENTNLIGKGFYNEFGIETALGHDAAEVGGWFHKIGIGLLKKEDRPYSFANNYQIQPAEFTVKTLTNKVLIQCKSPTANGYSYSLKKELELFEEGFRIRYKLENTGKKAIVTDEYNHNFLAINKELIGKNYRLNFPFELKPKLFGENVNTEGKVRLGKKEVSFIDTPKTPFFFSNLSGGKTVTAGWELINLKTKMAIAETASFQTDKVNLWGCEQVISPELFFKISVEPGQSVEWSRMYNIYNVT